MHRCIVQGGGAIAAVRIEGVFMKFSRRATTVALLTIAGLGGVVGLDGHLTVAGAQTPEQKAEPKSEPKSEQASPPAFASRSVKDIMRAACDYQLEAQAKTRPNNGWIRATFYTGVLATYRVTGDEKYKNAAVKWSEAGAWSPVRRDPRHADNQACIQVYTELYQMDKDPAHIAPAKEAYDAMIAAPLEGRKQWWWCDALFMAPPALARLASVTGDTRYLTFLNNQYWDSKDFLFDKEEHLFYRDKNYFKSRTPNGKKVFWSRGNGWVIAGLARILDYLPASDPRHADYVALYKEMAKRLAGLQGADGLWRSSLVDPEQFPMPETSGTAFYTFALAWGINQGLLDEATYLPVVKKGWAGLVSQLDKDGKLGHVQRVAGAPGLSRAEDTHEYAAGALLLAGEQVLRLKNFNNGLPSLTTSAGYRFDFGSAPQTGYTPVGTTTAYDANLGYGWTQTDGIAARDRGGNGDALHRDFLFSKEARTFRIGKLTPGRYRLTIVSGDLQYGDHQTKVSVGGKALETLTADAAEFATLTATVEAAGETLDISFQAPENTWVVNALSLEPTTETATASRISRISLPRPAPVNTWGPIAEWPDPITPYVARFRGQPKTAKLKATGRKREDYLKLIASEVDFWKKKQNADGAIVDPYRKQEFQYSTPAFAHAAAALVVYANRKDLLEPAAEAMDWASRTLSERKAASAHEDFYAPMLAHTLPLLKPLVAPERAARWEADIRKFDPYKTYRVQPGANNWNLVALTGEAFFQQDGLRSPKSDFVTVSLAAQGKHFASPWGLYLEGPMAYDHFPRLWAADMVAHHYRGAYRAPLTESLRRASLVSLFLQSPWGELPAGGRSAHHQWNEAEQCVTYEIYAEKAKSDGDIALAGIFKRAAHLSLDSMRRWVRPSGEMQIVKNWVDPKEFHAYESYSAHSQYNLLPMSMLAIAYEHAETTEDIPEQAAPSEKGGFVLVIDELHKVVANAGGTYIELDTAGDHHYDATGLIRVQDRSVSPQLGPSDSILAHASYRVPAQSPVTQTTGVGVSWQNEKGEWVRLGEMDKANLKSTTVSDITQTPERVSFRVRYEGNLGGATFIEERYVVTPGRVELTTDVGGYTGPLRYVWPVLSDDGKRKSDISVKDKTVMVTQDRGKTAQTFQALGASAVEVETPAYPNHNGWARLGVAEYPAGGTRPITLIIAPKK
jgi:rhamnogalacturonyl hydrolase YesR